MTNEEQVKTLKAQAYDFLAMKQHAERSLEAINHQLATLINSESNKIKRIEKELDKAAAEEKAANPSV